MVLPFSGEDRGFRRGLRLVGRGPHGPPVFGRRPGLPPRPPTCRGGPSWSSRFREKTGAFAAASDLWGGALMVLPFSGEDRGFRRGLRLVGRGPHGPPAFGRRPGLSPRPPTCRGGPSWSSRFREKTGAFAAASDLWGGALMVLGFPLPWEHYKRALYADRFQPPPQDRT